MKLNQEQVQRLQELEQNQRLTPAAVVKDASDPTNVLHSLFEWNDAAAAYAHRLEQARETIRLVQYTVTVRDLSFIVPRYIPDPSIAANAAGYLSFPAMATDPVLAVQAVTNEINRSLGNLARAHRIAAATALAPELGALVVALTRVRDEIGHGGLSAAAD